MTSSRKPLFPPLALPPIQPRIERSADGIVRLFDPLRNRFVALTPEEWVRQHFTAYLVNHLGYPAGLMANEVSLTFNNTPRRCDTVLFRRQTLEPVLIVEYKAPHIEITQQVFNQIARYNLIMKAPFLMVSNGLTHYCCMRADDSHPESSAPPYRFLTEIPAYDRLQELCPGL